jgi:predicted secreted protein
MGWVTGVATYIVIWWIVLFMVLPWGVRSIESADVAKGHAPSAPRRPRMLLKAAVTSAVAAAAWLIVYFVIESGVISISGE